MEEKTAYKVKITETLVKEVVVYANDELEALAEAINLHINGEITLDYDNYNDVMYSSEGSANENDIEIMDAFHCE